MREDRRASSPQLKSALGVVGLFASLATGTLVLLTLGQGPAIVFGGSLLVGVVLTTALAGRKVAISALITVSAILAVTSAITIYGVFQIASAIWMSGDNRAIPPPDPLLLAQATEKIDAESDEFAFMLELTEEELNAVLQDALAEANNPFRRVTVDITNAVGEDGLLNFIGEFKEGQLDVNGTLGIKATAGQLDIEILEIEIGMFTVPGIARSALEEMISDIADLQASLAAEGADVQNIVIGDDRVVITGINRSGDINLSAVVSAIADRVDLGDSEEIEPFYPAGRVNSTAADGNQYYVALGDSLAANIGVNQPRDGYVSRFHGWLEQKETDLGLRNFGISGETSGSLLHSGQLDNAVEFGKENLVKYVTIDIGANDLLGHLTSPDCSNDISTEACQQRIDVTLETYATNMNRIFSILSEAFPDATILLLTTYNPFGFGFEDRVEFESFSNATIVQLNNIAEIAASTRGILVADGFTALRGIATATTHMVDSPPDIHPNVVGYDLLAGALIAATP